MDKEHLEIIAAVYGWKLNTPEEGTPYIIIGVEFPKDYHLVGMPMTAALEEKGKELDREKLERKRQESTAKRWEYVPEVRQYGEDEDGDRDDDDILNEEESKYWMWDIEDKIARSSYNTASTGEKALWWMGNMHGTKEDAEAWGKEYGPYFDFPEQT